MDKRDKSLSIREIQRCLRTLSNYGMNIYPVRIDGVYGEETRNALKQFQAQVGIPVTGIADLITWNILMKENNEAVAGSAQPLGVNIYAAELNNGGKVKRGDTGNIVYVIQLILQVFNTVSSGDDMPEITGVYDRETEERIRKFQYVHNLAVTGVTDKQTWNMLARFYNDSEVRE